MLKDPDNPDTWHGDEEDGKLKKASPFYEPKRLLYTASDMERARADERARIFVEIDKLYERAELTGNVEAMDSLNVVELAIRSLGPFDGTREETERRVRRETIKEIKKAWDDAHDRHPTLGVFEEDARYVYPGRIEAFEKALAAIAEGRNL